MVDKLVSFGWGLSGRRLTDEAHGEGCEHHEQAGQGQHPHGIAGKAVFDDGTPGQSDDDLRDGDREVEDAHVDSHVPGFDGPREDGIGHGEDSGPGDADADHRDHQRILVVQQAESGETCGAQQQAGGVDGPVAPACGDAPQEEGGDAGRNGVGAVQHADPGLCGTRREDLSRRMVGDNPRDGGLEVGPHEEKGGP